MKIVFGKPKPGQTREEFENEVLEEDVKHDAEMEYLSQFNEREEE